MEHAKHASRPNPVSDALRNFDELPTPRTWASAWSGRCSIAPTRHCGGGAKTERFPGLTCYRAKRGRGESVS